MAAECLYGLRGDLNVAHQIELADFTDPHLLDDLGFLLDFQHAAGNTDPLSWTSDFDVDGRTVNLAQNQEFETGRRGIDQIR